MKQKRPRRHALIKGNSNLKIITNLSPITNSPIGRPKMKLLEDVRKDLRNMKMIWKMVLGGRKIGDN